MSLSVTPLPTPTLASLAASALSTVGAATEDQPWIDNQTSTIEDDTWVTIGSVTILSFTIAGALAILGAMFILELRGRPATVRTRLVQALVVSDLSMGIVGMIGGALDLSGVSVVPGSSSCDGLGFMLVAILWTQHLWTLTLALGTYLILIHPLHPMTMMLEKSWYYLWLLVWLFAIAVAIIGLKVYGYYPSGGICYYGSNTGLYSDLIQFIPRGFVFVCITLLYARLFVFLRRPDRIRVGGTNSYTGGSYLAAQPPVPQHRKLSNFLRKLSGGSSDEKQLNATPQELPAGEAPAEPAVAPLAPPTVSRPTHIDISGPDPLLARSPPVSPTSEVPPWERLELPAFQIDGQRYGGSNHAPNSGMWSNWKGLGGNPRKRPSTSGSTSPPPQAVSRFGSIGDINASPRDETRTRQRSGDLGVPSDRIRKFSIMSGRSNDSRRDSATATITHFTPLDPLHSHSGPDESRRSSMANAMPVPPEAVHVQPSLSEGNSVDVERGEQEDPDDEIDFLRMLRQDPAGGDTGSRSQEGEVELVPESMASYLNRKTSLLMLWFPLGYVFLFSISLIRIIYDFAGTPPAGLRALSRWFIFAQGFLDAVIYGLVEWHTKRVVRKRVRRGHLSPQNGSRGNGTNSFQNGAIGSALRAMNLRRSIPNGTGSNTPRGMGSFSNTQTNTQLGTQSVSGQQTRSVHNDDRFPRILQELKMEGETPRKGSVTTISGDSGGTQVEKR